MNVQLVPPAAASPHIRKIYEDARRALRLPWTATLFQAYAMYPGYLDLAWGTLAGSVETPRFAADARAIGNAADEAAARLYTPTYGARDVAAMNLDVLSIRDTVEAYRVNIPKLVLVATALWRAFEEGTVGGAVGDGSRVPGSAPEGAEEVDAQRITIELVDEAQAPRDVQRVYADIKETMGLPLVNSVYRAMALWPDYLALAWGDVKGVVGSPGYDEAARRLAGLGRTSVDRFAEPVIATRAASARGGVPATELENLGQILRFFADLLPPLSLNVAMFYRAIA